MSDHDDREWLDALAGRETAASPTRNEARALRDALRSREAPHPTAVTPDLAREAQLIARAVDEGLIATPAAQRPRWLLPLAAGVLLTLTAGILLRLQLQGPVTEVVRGEDAIVRMTSDDPAGLKQRILDELRAAGADATGYEALGAHGIDAELPLPISPALQQVLESHDIPAPANGVLRIEIRSRE